MFLWSKLLCCPLHDNLMIFLWLLSFCLILLTFAPLLGSQWYLVFGLRHKKYFRSVQMSRVQHRGEPDPLYAAAGQRSVLNCQSPGRDRISAHLIFKHVLWCAGDTEFVFLKITSTTYVFLGQKLYPDWLNCLLIPVLLKGFMILLCYHKPSEQFNNHGCRVYIATYCPSPAVALNLGLPTLNTDLCNPGLDWLHHYIHTVLTLESIMFPSPCQKDLQSSSSPQTTPLSICPRMQFCSVRLTPTLPTSPMSGWNKDRMFTILSEYRSPCIHEPKILFFC